MIKKRVCALIVDQSLGSIKFAVLYLQGYFRKGLALQKLQDFDGSVVSLAQGLAYETQSRQILSSIVETVLLSSLRG